MALIMEVMKTIAQPVAELALWLEETYQVDINETIAKWRELTGMKITVKESEVSAEEVESVNVETSKKVKVSKKIPKTKDVCQHIFLSGQKTGEQCSTKPKGGATFCSAHKPKDSVRAAKKESGSKKETKPNKHNVSDSETEEIPVSKEPKSKVSKKPTHSAQRKKTSGDTDEEQQDQEGGASWASEPEPDKLKPLLKKKSKSQKGSSKSKKREDYNTDEEHVDKDLNLSDEE